MSIGLAIVIALISVLAFLLSVHGITSYKDYQIERLRMFWEPEYDDIWSESEGDEQ